MSAVSSRWFWMDNGRQAGPVTWDELQQLARSGRLKAEGMVLREGSRNWQAAKSARAVEDGSSPATTATVTHTGVRSGITTLSTVEDEAGVNPSVAGAPPVGRMLFGLALFVGGLVGTYVSHQAAVEHGGGKYYIFTGPIIFGLCILLSAFGTPRKRA